MRDVGMCVCVCECMPLGVLIASAMIWALCDWLNKFCWLSVYTNTFILIVTNNNMLYLRVHVNKPWVDLEKTLPNPVSTLACTCLAFIYPYL